ncbi:MAG: glutamate synthase subunit beta [Cyclobacteriaceae bacterium]|nr:glutamate synthase subunit beta [Cyclobacteriaceae bacterium]
MGNFEGFLKEGRTLPETARPEDRLKNYHEFYLPHDESLTTRQASRCMDCGVPFCHNGCPLGNFIPDFNDAVYHKQWDKALDILLSTNNFPEFTGRICPAPCEGSCVLGINNPPVTIEHIEKSIIEKGFELGLIVANPPKERNKEKVAVVGSGPAGLAAADQLNKAGYHVTVFERDEKPGGLLRFGIPDFKLEKTIVERRISVMEQEGVSFRTSCHVGIDITGEELMSSYDAILLAGGSTIPRDLQQVPGRDLKGVHFAMDFLTQQNRRVSGLPVKTEEISAKDKHVIVIGGGDTGSDCIGTSNRHGARSVVQFEVLAKPPQQRGTLNPWPEWPLVLRTSSSHEEGCERYWSILTKSFSGNESGQVTSLQTIEVEWKDGRPVEIPGSEKTWPCDLALLAIGFLHPQKEGLLSQLGVELDPRGNVLTNQDYHTSVRNVFSAGDMRRGQSLVVWAISEGREAAKAIDEHLMQEGKSILPSKHSSNYWVG